MKPATRRANAVVAAYLLAGVPPLAVAAARSGRPEAAAVAITHAALLAAVLHGLRRGAAAPEPLPLRALLDWLPLLLLPLLYAELPQLIGAIGVPFQDARVIAWEAALFGAPARTLAAAWPSRAASELLHLGYLSYYPLIYAPPLVLYLRGDARGFGAAVLAVTIAYVACFAIFALFPVQGPRYLWPAPAGVPDGPIRRLTLSLLHAGSSRGTAFPSSHAAVAVAQAVVALHVRRPVGLAAALSAAAIIVGAVYGGFHYAIDMAAGAMVGLLAAWWAVLATGAAARGFTTSPAAPRPPRARRSGRTPPAPLRA